MSKGLAGVGNTPAHQYLITYFVLEIYRRFDKYKKYEDYRAYPEFDSEDNKNPDLSIYIRKKPTDELIVVIEFCTTKSFNKDVDKIIKQMQLISSIREGYIFNSDTFLMYKISRNKKGIPVKNSDTTDTIEAISFNIDKAVTRAKADLQPVQ
jgi:hypothetical protein